MLVGCCWAGGEPRFSAVLFVYISGALKNEFSLLGLHTSLMGVSARSTDTLPNVVDGACMIDLLLMTLEAYWVSLFPDSVSGLQSPNALN